MGAVLNISQKILDSIKPSEQELHHLKELTARFSKQLTAEAKKARLQADVFIGGSLAKDTLIKKEQYDIDVFVRFHQKYGDEKLSTLLEKILGKMVKRFTAQKGMKPKLARVHGSRDYFHFLISEKGKKNSILFEIVPVRKIKNQKEALNVTDLSYFHVGYILRKLQKRKNLSNEIRLAKAFCYAQKCYGAETHVKGFSGYALEVLVCHYKSFNAFLKAASSWSTEKKILIDPEKQYKNEQEILTSLNEAKLQSPVILIDPTYKLRNVAASISSETLGRFMAAAKKFIARPSEKFFEMQTLDEKAWKEQARKRKAEYAVIHVSSSLSGEIAAAKLVKFSEFFVYCMEQKGFSVIAKTSEFPDGSLDELQLFLMYKKPDKRMMVKGPPLRLEKHARAFTTKYRKTFVKAGRIHAEVRNDASLKEVMHRITHGTEKRDMGIREVSL